jgi:DNA-binding MarR family transcriptional regulator
MIIPAKNEIPREIAKGSVVLQLASAYFAIGKRLEQKTRCSQTRGFVMSTLRGGVALNQNQIAKLLGFDRTVVHRAIKTMIREALLSEKKAESRKRFAGALNGERELVPGIADRGAPRGG